MTLADGVLVRRVYRAPVGGAGTQEDPYRPLLPVALPPGAGWTTQASFARSGTADTEVLAGTATHEVLAAAPTLIAL
ncbi:MAG: hypothetical protein HY689_16075 [Chloroflexi bacterium]|nr:hypothetical protein [Chloroflexota bacterium]